ncbi:hypothetical protein K469DRAFT_696319 [Zopfia rhizophila CBS 207.26]|uniref:Uncharacterized protein n=1 Tax=Zopfia rhizophila CBS 207.26 TaxID=1314779 RepID=A0A6A6DES7_9PEZI|nr:hypothetical protein K469DRAFT_696319 [Zopfia rhizophila CBS 207.26]
MGINMIRPFHFEELFNALYIPARPGLEQLLKSKADPYLSHQPLSGNWRSFGLMVYKQCGCLVDVIPPEGATKPFNEYLHEEVDGRWTVILLHRTVQDLLQDADSVDDLYLELGLAKQIVEGGP